MRVNIISKANQVLKYLDPDFDTEGVDEGDWEEIYCEDFFSTGYADDAGAAHMFDYDYETGIVKFEYEGSEEDLIEIAKQGGDGGVEYIDDFLKKIKLFEEEFNIEWEIYEFIDDSGEDLGEELNQHNVHKKVTKELKKNHHLASFIIFYQEFLGYGEKKQPDDELNAVKKLMYKWKIISEEDDDGEVLELYEKIGEGIKTYEDGFLKIGHTISNLNLDDNQILTFVKACIEMYLFTNSSDGKFTGDELVSDDEIKYRFYEGYDEETKKAFKNLKFLEIINDSIGDDKVVKILLDMIMNQLNEQNISEEYKQYQLTINKIGFITGEESKQVSLSELAKAIVSGEDNYEGYIESSETGWRESVREHGEYGPTTLIDIIINPDGSELDVDLNKFYPEDSEPVDGDENIGSIGTFSEFRFVIDKGTMSNYTMDLEKEFDSKYLRPVFNEHSLCGIISHYEYDNKEASDSELFIESEIEESRPSMGGGIYLFYNDEQGLKQLWDFDELKKEMNAENINVSELSEVVQFLESKYKKLD